MQSYNDYIELRERVLMSKKLDQVGLEPTTFGFPCLCSYELSYWSDNGPEAWRDIHYNYNWIEFTGLAYRDIVSLQLVVQIH